MASSASSLSSESSNGFIPIKKQGLDGAIFPSNLTDYPRWIEFTITEKKLLSTAPGASTTTSGGNILESAQRGATSGWEELKSLMEMDFRVTTVGQIFLPLPTNLGADYSANWSGNALSPLEYAIREYGKTGDIGAATEAYTKRMFLSGVGLLGQTAAGKLGIASKTVAAAGGAVVKGAGVALNPFQQLLYSGPNFRTFSFDWVLSPASKEEAQSINKIIWYFKKYMHTASGIDDMFFAYPGFCTIKFMDKDGKNIPYLFGMKECAITRVNVQYERKFHTDGAPVAVRLSVDFLETALFTQNDFSDSYIQDQIDFDVDVSNKSMKIS